ncbi:MAG: fibrobacter succinogenes major paralogous domain-containing protein [Bacteroidales bacterium]|nr:fibrobacter succinogenes major paralogous domain-containing protein [Bacteroidales bacterium]
MKITFHQPFKDLILLFYTTIISMSPLVAQHQFEFQTTPPEKMSYQALLRNNNNQLIINREVKMKISIVKGSTSGTLVYSEIHTPTSDAGGLVSLEIGRGTEKNGSFNSFNWADAENNDYYIKTETDPAGGINYTITQTSRLLYVPYALHAKTAGNVSGLDELAAKYTSMENMLIEAKKYIVKDIEGNKYKTIQIGSQLWMAENLKTTKYNDGTSIPLTTNWNNQATPWYCWYNNNAASYKNTYGALYNWHTVNSGKLCPAGWHVPTDAEWTILENFMIGYGYNYDNTITGNKIAKALASTAYWYTSASTGTIGNTDYPNKRNASGFSALPGGYLVNTGFIYLTHEGVWWSSSESDNSKAYARGLFSTEINLYNFTSNKCNGYSVRCVRD